MFKSCIDRPEGGSQPFRRSATGGAIAIGKVAARLVPFIALMFFINFLDRTAISFAGPNGMAKDLGLTAAQFGFAAGVFFAGYIVLEIPSNLALHKFGARRWLARIMVTWGIVAALFTWVNSVGGLYTLRFLLGVAEAGFFSGAILYLSLWVPAKHRSQILALFYLAQPLTIVIGAPVASLLLQADGLFGLAGWRIMFLGVAVPAIIVGIATWFYLVDRPADARWLSATIISGFETQFGSKLDVIEKGVITAIPYLPAAVALFFWSRDASRRGVRAWHIALPALVGAASIETALHMNSPAATIATITVTACAIFSALPSFWAIPSRFLSGAAAAAGIALINTIGNLAGFTAPYVTGLVKDMTGSYQAPMLIVAGFMLLSAILAVVVGRTAELNEAPAEADPRTA